MPIGIGGGNVSTNTAIGVQALTANNASATNNTAVGFQSLSQISAASAIDNTAIGYQAGQGAGGGTNANNQCTFVGSQTSAASGTKVNSVALGYGTIITTSNTITLGNSAITTIRCQVGTITTPSDVRDKKDIEPIPQGLSFINDLKPVKFTWNMRDKGKIDIDEFGFIAQELEQTQNKFGVVPNLVDASDPDKYAASYGTLLPVMVKAIQDLTSEIEEIKKKL